MLKLYIYKANPTRVIDGDTVDLAVNLGFMIIVNARFRLADIDAPEISRPLTKAEYEGGIKVTEYVKTLLDEHKNTLYVESLKLDIYGRYGGYLFYANDKVKEGDIGYYNDYPGLVCINDLIDKFMIDNHLTKKELREIVNEVN